MFCAKSFPLNYMDKILSQKSWAAENILVLIVIDTKGNRVVFNGFIPIKIPNLKCTQVYVTAKTCVTITSFSEGRGKRT